jgi:dimethylaniline monooxygenase (N-oxide forming)
MRHLNDGSKAIAVIGAGISGIMAAKYLRDVGLDVTVFERSTGLGGIWLAISTLRQKHQR